MQTLLTELVRVGRITPCAAYQRLGYACGALLVASGLFHVVVYLLDGGGWDGPLSWRKPVVFGLSFGITLVTVTWILGFLRMPRVAGWLLVGLFAAASLGEVVLISMQTWRGVASHFNEATPFDSAVFSAMGMLVSVIALLTVVVTVWAFVRLDAPASLALAIRLGLVLMLVSQAVGVQMIAEGGSTFGAAGALKLPHAFTLHAVQVLPALALVLLVSDVPEQRRVRVVEMGAAGYAALIAATATQTYAGRTPLDPGPLAVLLALAGLALLMTSAVLALRALTTRTGTPAAPGRLTVGDRGRT
jgi:hypothetical protein